MIEMIREQYSQFFCFDVFIHQSFPITISTVINIIVLLALYKLAHLFKSISIQKSQYINTNKYFIRKRLVRRSKMGRKMNYSFFLIMICVTNFNNIDEDIPDKKVQFNRQWSKTIYGILS